MPVKVLTDHKALIPMFKKQSETGNLRVDRFLLELKSKFDLDVVYYPGKSNVVADALSRGFTLDGIPASDEGIVSVRRVTAALVHDTSVCDDHELWIGELESGDMSAVYKFLRDKELPLDATEKQRTVQIAVQFTVKDQLLYRTNSDGSVVVCVPESSRAALIREWHSGQCGAHRSGQSIFDAFRRRYFWPSMRADCAAEARACLVCAQFRQPRKNQAPLVPIVTTRPWELVCVDVLEIGTSRSKNRYVLSMMDHFSKWAEAEPIPNKESGTIAQVIVEKWILRFGCMERLHSDMGRELCNETLNEICRILGMHKSTTRGYDASANGLVERFNRTLLAALQRSTPSTYAWDDRVAYLVFSHNVTPNSSTGYFPFEVIFGKLARFPTSGDLPERPRPEYTVDMETYLQFFNENLDQIRTQVRENTSVARQKQKEHHDKQPSVGNEKYHVGDRVMVHVPNESNNAAYRKLAPRNFGPYEIKLFERTAATVVPVGRPETDAIDVPLERLVPVPRELGDVVVLPTLRRRPRAGTTGAGQKRQQERTPTQHNYDLRPRVRRINGVQLANFPGRPSDDDKIWTIGTHTKTAFELNTACSNEIEGHEHCCVPTVKDIDDVVTDEGDFWNKPVVTIMQEAMIHMVIREKGARIAEHIGTEMLEGGPGQEMPTYLAARGDMLKPNVVPSEDDFRTAILHRFENCHVAKKALKASGHRRISFETNQQDFVDARQRRAWQESFGGIERIVETVRAQRVHNADHLLDQKMIVIGDSTAAELGNNFSETAKITGKRLADVIRQFSKTVFRSAVRTVLVVAGRDAMLDDDRVETFIGQCEKLAGMLSSYPGIKVYWMIPPFVSDKAEKYDDMATSLISMLDKTKFEIVATRGLRSVAEIFRHGGRNDRFNVDSRGSLTEAGRVQVLEYLREVHRFPLNEPKKKEQGMKRAYENSGHGSRDAKQHRAAYEKHRSEPQSERKGHYQRRHY